MFSFQESAILKRRSTNTLQETQDSPSDQSPKSNLKIETLKVDIQSTHNATQDYDQDMDYQSKVVSPQDSDEEMSQDSKCSSKAVLISRCQALRDQDMPVMSHSTPIQGNMNGRAEPEEIDIVMQNEETKVPLFEKNDSERRYEEQTPEVRIHPATPEVLAAHKSHTEVQPKRSVITLTLRPRNPSESSSGGASESLARVVSRTPSVISSCSSSSSASNSAVNGMDKVYQNGHLDDVHREKKTYGGVCDLTPEIRITPMAKMNDTSLNHVHNKKSTRSTNTNKTASFVVINTPSASPRAPRTKTLSTSSFNGSQRSYAQNGTKSRESSVDSYKSQRSSNGRKENGFSTKHSVTEGKNPNFLPSVSYCSSVKNGYSGLNNKSSRYERGESRYSRDNKCDKREVGYERGEKQEGDQPHNGEPRLDREIKYQHGTQFGRNLSCFKDHRYNTEPRFHSHIGYAKNALFDPEFKFDRDGGRCDADFKYERGGHCDGDYSCDGEGWCDRDYEHKYEGESRYERDSKYEYKYRRDSRCERDCVYDRGEVMGKSRVYDSRDHYPSPDYPKGPANTATNPAVMTESSV